MFSHSTKIRSVSLILVFLLMLAFNCLPLLAFSSNSSIPTVLVPCGRGSKGPEDCTFISLLTLINNVLLFFTYAVAFPLSVMLIIYAGGQMIWFGNTTPGKVAGARKLLQNTLIGLAIVFAAVMIIQQVLGFFISPDSNNPIQQAMHTVFNSIGN